MHPGYHHPTHPLNAGRRATHLWYAATLGSITALAFVLASVAHLATVPTWPPTALPLLLLTGLTLDMTRLHLTRRAWQHVHHSAEGPHPADIVVSNIRGLMVVLTFMSIMAPDAAFPNRAVYLGVIAGTGLLTIGIWQRAGRYIRGYGLPRRHISWRVHDIHPLLTAATVLGLALYHSPQAAQTIPYLVGIALIPLLFIGMAKPPNRLDQAFLHWLQRQPLAKPEN